MNAQCPPLSRTLNHLFSATAPECEFLLHRCAAVAKSLPTLKKLHAHIITSGILSNHFLSLLTVPYGSCGHSQYACKLFDRLPKPTVADYRSIMRMHTKSGHPRHALQLFVEMRKSGHYSAENYTYPFAIRACGHLALLESGMVFHGLTVKSGTFLSISMGNYLLAMYMNCGDENGARLVFDAMEDKTVVSWNTMISGHFRNGSAKKALMVFWRMVDSNVDIDTATVLSVLPACGSLKSLKQGRKVHLLIKNNCIGKRLAVQNALVDMYVKCGSMDEARAVFGSVVERNVITWSTMINGYILNEDFKCALEMYRLMQFEGVRPNAVTLATLLAMCVTLRDLKLGKCLHGWAIRHCIDCEVDVETALIHYYAKCSCFGLSLRVFSRTCQKRTVPWTAILSGCIHNNLASEAIKLFKRMLMEAVELNDATLMSLLPAYAVEADLCQASNIHGYVIKSGFLGKRNTVTGLIDIYAKCGSLEYAHKLFDGLSVRKRDSVLWGAIISCFGKHGHGRVAVSLFNEMVHSGIKPDEVSFTSVLDACRHAGLVDDGLKLFIFMQKNHHEWVRTDHYTCIIDLLGRDARLEEAYRVIRATPCEASPAPWSALLGACVRHENVELGEMAAKVLFEMEPENPGIYVLLGNIYSAVGRFDDAERVREVKNKIGLVKQPANSVVMSV